MSTMTKLLVVVAMVAGCKTATLTAGSSVNPVLVGPVHSLGGGPVDGEPVGTFGTENVDQSMSSADGQGNSSHSHSRDAVGRTDWDVLTSTNGDPNRVVVVENIRCSGFSHTMLFFFWSKARCQMSGSVREASR